MIDLDTPELRKITHRYQMVRTALNIAMVVILGFVLFRLNQLATSNQKALDQLQQLGRANHSIQVNTNQHVNCIADVFIKSFVDQTIPTTDDTAACN